MNFTKALADRGIKEGVRVNAFNPGSIATERLQVRIKHYAKEKNIDLEEAAKRMPREMKIARFDDSSEIARWHSSLLRKRLTFKVRSSIWKVAQRGHCSFRNSNIIR